MITAKKEARNTWGTSGRQYDIDNFMQSNKAAKKAVAIAKARAMNELYEELAWNHRRVKEKYLG